MLDKIIEWITESIEKHIGWTVSLISISLSSIIFLILLCILQRLILQYGETAQCIIISLMWISCFSITIVYFYLFIKTLESIRNKFSELKKLKMQAKEQKIRCKNLYPKEIWNIITQLVNNGNVAIKINTDLYKMFESKGFVYPALCSQHWMIVAQNGGFEFLRKEENIDEYDLTDMEKKNRDSDFDNTKPYGLRYVRLQEHDYQTIKKFCFVKKHKMWVSTISPI